jgi:hypothetical protein
MSSVVIAGNTSGTVTLSAPDVAGTTVLTLPSTSGFLFASATAGTLGVASGGTGAATLTANNVLLGNGTSAVQVVAPGTSGNVLTSNGTTWSSTALPAGGVTSLNGQTGAITDTTLYAIGSYITGRPANNSDYLVNTTLAGSSLYTNACSVAWYAAGGYFIPYGGSGTNINSACINVGTGTWRCVSPAYGWSSYGLSGLWVRIS